MSSEAQMLRDLVGQVAGDHPEEPPQGELPPVWDVLRPLGLARLGIAEDLGGDGGSVADLVAVVGALGLHAVGTPMVETAVANWAISHAEPLGDSLTTIAVPTRFDLQDGRLDAEFPVVPWGRAAGRLVCVPAQGSPLVVDLEGPSVEVDPGGNLAGEQRDLLRLSAVPAKQLDAVDPVELRIRLALLRAAAIEGAARGAFELTRAYVREREQFGKPLINIPAVASGLAEMRMQLTLVDAALVRAGGGFDADPLDGDGRVAAARIIAADAATAIAGLAHQLHGAMGMTQEYPLHRFTRLLWAWRDAEMSERAWATELGEKALLAGEAGVWQRLTA